MTEFEIMPLHRESERAPSGVCELTIQAAKQNPEEYRESLQSNLSKYVEETLQTKTFEYDDDHEPDRMVIFTGTDRLDIATLRDIAEVYGSTTDYRGGNIPPELSLVPTSNGQTYNRHFAWLEFKLEMELPASEVQLQVGKNNRKSELVPKNPVGENMEAIVFRDGNMANHQVRGILSIAKDIRDAVPVDYIRLVCEPKREE